MWVCVDVGLYLCITKLWVCICVSRNCHQSRSLTPHHTATTTTLKPVCPQSEPEWAARTEEARAQVLDRHQDNERSVTSSLLLCNETIHMMM